MTRRVLIVALAAVALTAPASASAQPYPNKPIVLVAPFAPGGPADSGARKVGKELSDKLGQPVVIDNKPGANGIVGAEFVANAKPDGYTLFYGSSGPMGINVSIHKKLSYDPLKSFVAIHGIGISPMVLVTAGFQPHKTFQDFAEHARKNPGKMNFSSVGSGSTQHLGNEFLYSSAGLKLTHVPYKGTAPSLADVLTGVIDVMMDNLITIGPLIEAGKLRPLVVLADKRLPSLPNVPTTAEVGLPGVVMSTWSSLAAPAGTPQPVIDLLASAMDEIMQGPGMIKYYEDNGSVAMGDVSKEKLTAFYVSEIAKFRKIVETSGATVE